MKFILYLFFLGFTLNTFSQRVKILDQETGKTVKNITVFNASKTKTLTSNRNGTLEISSFNEKEQIFFSHISYALYSIRKSDLKRQNFTIYMTKQSEKLDEVVLSVFKKNAKTNRIAEQTAIVSSKEIQKISPQTSADLLANIPGIKVQKSQFGGGSPVLRGMESNRVLLVVDGIRLNNAIYRKGHLQNAITIAPNLLDRTEVVFGPSSVIYGSDALGGIIHYYTKTPKISEKASIKSNFFSRYSSVNNENTITASTTLGFKRWATFTSVSVSDFGDLKMGNNRKHGFEDWGKVAYYSENSENRYVENPTMNSDETLQRNTGYRQVDVLQKFFIPLSNKTDLKLNFQYSTSSNIPRFDRLSELTDLSDSSSLKFAEWYYGPQKRLLISPQLDLHPEKKWMEKGTITFGYQNIQESRIQRKFGSLNRSYREETVNIFSVNGDFSVPLTKKRNRNFGYGFELSYNDVNSNSYGKTLSVSGTDIIGFSDTFAIQSRYPDGGSDYTTAAIYSDYRQDITSNSTLNTGIRFTHTQLNATWIDQTFISLPKTTINLANSAVTATIGYVFKPDKNWQINSVLSSGFRSPNVDDVGRVREKNGEVTVPNINLRPEFAYNAEIGLQKYFNNKRFRIDGNVYYTLLDNYIQRDTFELDGAQKVLFDGELGDVVANQNRGNAYIMGYTINYQGKIANHWKTSGFITYTKGATYDTNESMSSIPPLFGQFELLYNANRFEIGVHFQFNSKKDIDSFNISEGIDNHDLTPIVAMDAAEAKDMYFGTPSWAIVGLFGSYDLHSNWKLQGRIDNMFDLHYREFASGISAPGRNMSLAIIADF